MCWVTMKNSIKRIGRNSFEVQNIKTEGSWSSKGSSMTNFVIASLLASFVILTICSSLNATTSDGICQSKDIRNHPYELNILKGCRVIEGFLMITLIDRYNETDYDNLTFPELVEITDFLILYRVQGLKSLGHLFPNLQVIRGNHLVNNYALIIYEMLQLQDIGLKSLTTISRGSVHIRNNPLLCFVHTINWAYIANGTHIEDHVFESNKNSYECPVCSSVKRNYVLDGNDMECPVSKQDPNIRYCWNRNTCQKICPDVCGSRSCDDEGNCCNEECLGSCQLTNRSNCTVCRKMGVGKLSERKCIDTCPPGTYEFNERCITENECRNTTRPFFIPGDNSAYPYIPFQGTCSSSCPINYAIGKVNGELACISCDGKCKKECHGSKINSISSAQLYRGCAKIIGTLIIEIRPAGQQVVNELERSLSDIEEIEGGLKVIRSYPLISLSFFKKLRAIHGKNDDYTLFVMNNPNLQSLFGHEVRIPSGKLFFHFNSKLCYHEIEALKKDVDDLKNVHKIAIEEVSTTTNGDRVACNVTNLATKISSVMHFGAVIDVQSMKYADSRVLMGYVAYFRPAPFQNVTLFDGRDACGGDGWRSEYVTSFDRDASVIQIILTNLKPFTQYAYYVKTDVIITEPYGGQTDIQYFRTLPAQPGIVQKMAVLPNGSASLIVTWEPPKASNGILTNYIVKASLIKDNVDVLQDRNYCEEPLERYEETTFATPAAVTTVEDYDIPEDNDSEAPSMQGENSDIVEQRIDFENEIGNIVYVKRIITGTGGERKDRRRRTIESAGNYSTDIFLVSSFDQGSRRSVVRKNSENNFFNSELKDGYYVTFSNEMNASVHTFTLDKLRHFSMYLITVQACRDSSDTNFNVDEYCSNVVVKSRRTEKRVDADNIEALTYQKVSNSKSNMSSMKLKWEEPKNPNGLILKYAVIYKQVGLEYAFPIEQCVTRHMHANLSGEIPLLLLPKGNYSISVRATSLAGNGKRSSPIYFVSNGSYFNFNKIQPIQIVAMSVLLCISSLRK